MKIFIDAGHGGQDPGAVGANGLHEADVVLQLALKLGVLLGSRGINVVYSRQSNVFIDLVERPQRANSENADYLISLHCNSASNAKAQGTETFIALYPEGSSGAFAACVQRRLINALGATNRGVKSENFAVLRYANMPAILIELAFISNLEEEKKLADESFLNSAALAIANGVFEHTGVVPLPTIEDCTQDFVWRKIITNKALWDIKAKADSNIAALLKEAYAYIRNNGGSVKDPRSLKLTFAVDILHKQSIIPDKTLLQSKAQSDQDVYWLLVKIADYIN